MITITDFDRLKITTMTVLVFYDVIEINLPALFLLLPISRIVIPENTKFCKKQGKIIPPAFLNEDGVIISMRFDKKVRGIIRSEKLSTFLHAIIIDIGTKLRIISMKLTKGSIELTGATSYEMALEYSDVLLRKIIECQEMINKIRENHIPLEEVIEVISLQKELPQRLESIMVDGYTELHEEYYQNLYRSRIFESVPKFIEYANYVLEFVKYKELFVYQSPKLKINRYESIMVNLSFSLGFCIKQTKLAEIMNTEPFVCNFNNTRDGSAVTILYHYIKNLNTLKAYVGNEIELSKEISKHTIVVYGSGYSKYSGPSLEAMRPVYNTFMQKILLNYEKFYKLSLIPMKVKIAVPCGKALSIREFIAELDAIEEYNNKIRNCEVPMLETTTRTPVIDITI